MAKASPAKTKMLASRAKKEAAEKRAAKKILSTLELHVNDAKTAPEPDENDFYWHEIGLAAPARRALIAAGIFRLSDLRKESFISIKQLHGMGPNAIRILSQKMKENDLSFRK